MFAASKTAGATGGVNYIEDVFSTYLYTGTGATQTITNSIDTTTYGGLVWIKGRSGATGHRLTDTVRGVTKSLASETTAAQATEATGLTAFGTTGFTIGADADYNTSAATYVGWTFREQPKFFDVVTYTGTGSAQNISHNLGSVPGCIIIKQTGAASNWAVYHKNSNVAPQNTYLALNDTAAAGTSATWWNSTTPTSTVFTVGTSFNTNSSGGTYVAYLFASDAGGFGLTGTDNVISCGSYTGNGLTSNTITLGYEPQWLLIKLADAPANWMLFDVMRGMTAAPVGGTPNDAVLNPNLSGAETSTVNYVRPTATGFELTVSSNETNADGNTYIYIAIRRGPMKEPTSGTSVFSPIASSAATGTAQTTNFPLDAQWINFRGGDSANTAFLERLISLSSTTTEAGRYLTSSSTVAEVDSGAFQRAWNNTGFSIPSAYGGVSTVYYNLQRAPSFMDVVCYTGTGSATTQTHNLGVAPEFMILKERGGAGNWTCYSAAYGGTYFIPLNTTAAASTSTGPWSNTNPTASVFTVGTSSLTNNFTSTYVAYLFATCAGVSKVGSYTGTATTKQVDCGFTAGARFVLIKRTDSTGDWYVWDSARGIIAGNDPYLLLNSTAAEVTSTDYVDTYSAGFEISSTAPAAINASGGTFIFLAIA